MQRSIRRMVASTTARLPVACALLVTFALVGCSTPSPLPTYPWEGVDAAMTTLRERPVPSTVQSECRLLMMDGAGFRIHLDGVLIVELPDRFRLRTWKHGRPAFDLTITPEGRWVETGRGDAGEAEHPDVSGFATMLDWLSGKAYHDPELWLSDEDAATFTMSTQTAAGESGLAFVVDKKTRTARLFIVRGSAGTIVQSVHMRDWDLIGEQPWPTRVTADGLHGTFDVRVSDLALDEPVAAVAFVPPATAVRVDDD